MPSRSREVEPLEVSEIFHICALQSCDHFAVSEFQSCVYVSVLLSMAHSTSRNFKELTACHGQEEHFKISETSSGSTSRDLGD